LSSLNVVAFNGSPRKEGNTSRLIERAFIPLQEAGVDCEMIRICGRPLQGCTACLQCRENQDRKCVIDDDIVNHCIEKMIAADGIIIASPTYFANITAETKALIDRAGYVVRGNGNLLRRKVGAAVIAVRRAGALHAFNSINHFFLINEMTVCGSSYWNLGVGRAEGEVEQDEEGMQTMDTLGRNMAWLLGKLAAPA
jgi:multimeric flavodoxin WrbA